MLSNFRIFLATFLGWMKWASFHMFKVSCVVFSLNYWSPLPFSSELSIALMFRCSLRYLIIFLIQLKKKRKCKHTTKYKIIRGDNTLNFCCVIFRPISMYKYTYFYTPASYQTYDSAIFFFTYHEHFTITIKRLPHWGGIGCLELEVWSKFKSTRNGNVSDAKEIKNKHQGWRVRNRSDGRVLEVR